MLTSSASTSMSTVNANKPVVIPVNRDALAGVPCISCTRANHPGNNPSRAITMYTLGWPIRLDSSAVVIAATAVNNVNTMSVTLRELTRVVINPPPKEMKLSAQPIPASLNATANGASCTQTTTSVESPIR